MSRSHVKLTLFLMALSRSLTEFPLYVLNRLKSGTYTRKEGLQTHNNVVSLHVDKACSYMVQHRLIWAYLYLSVEAQRYASSSWFVPLLFQRSLIWPQLDCLLAPSRCGHLHPVKRQKYKRELNTGRLHPLSIIVEKKNERGSYEERLLCRFTFEHPWANVHTWKKRSCFSGLQKKGCLSTHSVEGRDSTSALIICSIRSRAMTSSARGKKNVVRILFQAAFWFNWICETNSNLGVTINVQEATLQKL